MNLRPKLIAAFSLFAVISVGVNLIALRAIFVQVGEFNEITRTAPQNLITLSEINTKAARVREEALSFSIITSESVFLAGDEISEEAEEEAEEMEAFYQETLTLLTQYQPSSEANRLFAEMEQQIAFNYQTSLALVNLKQGGGTGMVILAQKELLEEAEDGLEETIFEAIELERSRFVESQNAAIRLTNQATVIRLATTFFVGILAIISGLVVANGIGNPIRELTAMTERIGLGDLAARNEIVRNDELGRLAVATNDMAQKLQTQVVETRVAQESSQFKSSLLARVSHELRTPLGVILGFAGLLHEKVAGPINARQTEILEKMMDNCNRLEVLINELLDQARFETNNLSLTNEPFSPEKSIHEVISALEGLAQEKALLLQASVSANVPELIVGDPNRFEQILINLVGNSIKFTENGFVRVHASQENGRLMIQVADSGIGIPEDAQELVFEPFRQADESLTRTNDGTGLGLSIVKQLVNLMKGEILLESRVGKGTTFTVHLPVEKMVEEGQTG